MLKNIFKNDLNSVSLIDIILCAIMSFGIVTARPYVSTGECHFSLSILASFLFNFAFLLLTTFIIRRNLNKLINKTSGTPKNRILSYWDKMISHPTGIIVMAIFLFIGWLPTLICLYPGTLVNDSWVELSQFACYLNGSNVFSDHHPIFDTWLMGTFILKPALKTGQWHIVIFLFVAIQAALTALSFSGAIYYLHNKLKVNSILSLVLWISYLLIPVYPACIQTVSKDSIFSWIFVLFYILFIEIFRSNGESMKKVTFFIAFLGLAILCCLTKKVGIYVVVLSLLVILIAVKKSRIRLLITLITVVSIMFIAMPRIQEKLEIAPGGKQEMFSLPFQMTARVVKYHGDDVTPEEHDVIDKVLFYDELAEIYEAHNADVIKHGFQKGADEDYVEYLKVVFKQGLRHPVTYFEAVNGITCGWFSWYEFKPLTDMDWHSGLNPEFIPESVSCRGFSETSARAYTQVYNDIYCTPLGLIFLSYGLYASLIPAFAISSTWRKNLKKHICVLTPVLASIVLGCWLAPVCIHIEGVRYLYPIIYTTPLVVGYCIYLYSNKSAKGDFS